MTKRTKRVAFGVLVVLVGFGAAVRTLLVSTHWQASGSMLPGIAMGERIVATPVDAVPTRGRIVVFDHPEHPEQSFVKRVVAVGGDTVEMTDDGAVKINGWAVPRCKVGAWSNAGAGDPAAPDGATRGELWLEHLGDARYLVFLAEGSSASPKGPWKVAPGGAFVVGDNRHNSHDSRMWFAGEGGSVPRNHVTGRLLFHDEPKLPKGAEGLAGALADCLAKRPAQTSPPPPP